MSRISSISVASSSSGVSGLTTAQSTLPARISSAACAPSAVATISTFSSPPR